MKFFYKIFAIVPVLVLGMSMHGNAQFNPVPGYEGDVLDKLYVINAGGEYMQSPTKEMFDFNVGEPVVETFNMGGAVLTQGFLQPIFVDNSSPDLPFGPIYVNQDLSPNGDGRGHEKLTIDNIENYPNNHLTIYNRWQSLVYETDGYNNETNFFDGNPNNKSKNQFYADNGPVPDGSYYYVLELKIGGYPKPVFFKGYIILKRK